MLEVNNLSKEYPTPRGGLPILSDVSLRLARGDAVSIMGPSGSGKSSFLYIVGALEPPTSGTVTLDCQNPFTMPERELAAFRNRRIGFIFQDHCLLPQLTVLENVLTPTLVGSAPAGAGDDGGDELERARALLDQVGLTARSEHRPAELSGGEKQRVALARALIRRPLLLLCDEPTGNLDHVSAATVSELLLELHRRQETILVVVTHNAELAAKFPVRYELQEQNLIRSL